ncbi:50S ribosomal protein L25/general stress protein Ctc [Leptolyngbya sp. PCC 6406]|uniref:50S ribosomal protein L25/general stress protein Ctc n=1 Tax=Leptolyngbya sp. PCC 6406 TaxID=1173264 RepID=UPI0002ABDD26|nr:50S ribosomal protein L25/general stress protein Ctc [Leptolyngbya sp. PCC 6406]
MELTIECSKRTPDQKPKALRRAGLMPAVLYGHNGADSVDLTLNTKEAETLVKKASINNTLINLSIPDLPWTGKALLREVQAHPWKKLVYHISFFSIAAQDSVEVVVPVHYVGIPYGVSQDGGVLDTVLNDLAIRCAPNAIPETLDVDVSALNVGDSLHISDLVLPPGVLAVAETNQLVASVLGRAKAESGDEPAAEAAPAVGVV